MKYDREVHKQAKSDFLRASGNRDLFPEMKEDMQNWLNEEADTKEGQSPR